MADGAEKDSCEGIISNALLKEASEHSLQNCQDCIRQQPNITFANFSHVGTIAKGHKRDLTSHTSMLIRH